MATNATLLAAVESAIEDLLSGRAQSYSISDRSVTRLDMGQLFSERRRLLLEVARDANGVGHIAKIGRPSK